MTEQQQPEQKKKAGSIRQYATLGRGKTPERPDVSTSRSQSVETLESQDAQESERRDVRESGRSGVETSKRQSVQESEHSGVRTLKRERHTIYLPPELSEWVKIRAIKTKREISELVTEAVERYRAELEQ